MPYATVNAPTEAFSSSLSSTERVFILLVVFLTLHLFSAMSRTLKEQANCGLRLAVKYMHEGH